MKAFKHWLGLAIYRKIKLLESYANMVENNDIKKKFAFVGENVSFRCQDSRIKGCQYIRVGNNFSVGKGFRLEAIDNYMLYRFSPEIVIGDNVRIEDYCHIGCVEKVVIGDGVLIASKVFISDHFHGKITKDDIGVPPSNRPLSSKPVVIGNNVWIGDNVSILPGITLGNNVIIGANSVVTHSFPANSVIAGCPARIIKILD